MTYRNFDEESLEREYTPASRIENIQVYLDSYKERGMLARREFSHEKLIYGEHPDEWLWYAPKAETKSRRLVVFVHGGFWRRLSADDGTFLTPKFHEFGQNFASINYSLCPTESLETLVDQTSRAIDYLVTRHDAKNMTLIGHSAGAHLIAMAMCRFSAPEFASALFVSGIFDLEPISQMSVNDAVQLDLASAHRFSPIHFVSQAKNTPVGIIWGENETGEFKRQSLDFASSWSSIAGHSTANSLEISLRNHFDVLDDLTEPTIIQLINSKLNE